MFFQTHFLLMTSSHPFLAFSTAIINDCMTRLGVYLIRRTNWVDIAVTYGIVPGIIAMTLADSV
ncbi:hypothetical protein BDV09DRAFT_157776 [Aspergillus tetrazonus]